MASATTWPPLDGASGGLFAGDERVLWEGPFWGGTQQHIIGYGSYHYKGRSGAEGEWFIVGLAAQKNYLSALRQCRRRRASPGARRYATGSAR